jgi:hypothetical protein
VCVKFCKTVLADLVFLASGPFFCSAPAEPFFRPGHAIQALARAGAVKDAQFARPRGLALDGPEHDGRIERAGDHAATFKPSFFCSANSSMLR